MRRVVIDTNVFVSSLFNSKGVPRKIIDLWKAGGILLCVSKEIIEEYINVLARFDFVESMEIRHLLRLFHMRQHVVFTTSTPNISIISADADDDKFIECAVSSDAEYIISGDKHLKNLGFYGNIKILSPSEFMDNYIERHS